jgi:alpha-D-xyloside xylohydrolase
MEKGYLPVPTETTAGSGSDFAVEAVEGQIDFSNPEAEAWYRRLIGHLFDQGASVIKTDFGEEIRMDVSYAGMSAAELRNLYAVLYQRAAFRETAGRTGEAVIWARAGWAGAQRYPVHWGGDAAASWEGMAGTLRGGLHIGLSGFGFWSHDVPGFHGVPHFMNSKPDEELYLRWTQFGVLSSHLRYHGTWPREPWHFPGVFASVREWLELRYALIPYLLEQAALTARTGMPMLRALPLQFPDDPVAWNIDSQYLLGSDLLVAPLLQPGGRRDVYLPSGRWHDFFTGEILVGPRWIRGRVWPPARLPLYLRSDAELPLYPEAVQCTDEMDLTRTVRIRVDADFDGIASTPVGSYIDL